MTYESCYDKDEVLRGCFGGEGEEKCAPKFYITWFGTDKNGNQFKTSNLAMSKFQKYSISDLYDSIKNIIK